MPTGPVSAPPSFARTSQPVSQARPQPRCVRGAGTDFSSAATPSTPDSSPICYIWRAGTTAQLDPRSLPMQRCPPPPATSCWDPGRTLAYRFNLSERLNTETCIIHYHSKILMISLLFHFVPNQHVRTFGNLKNTHAPFSHGLLLRHFMARVCVSLLKCLINIIISAPYQSVHCESCSCRVF